MRKMIVNMIYPGPSLNGRILLAFTGFLVAILFNILRFDFHVLDNITIKLIISLIVFITIFLSARRVGVGLRNSLPEFAIALGFTLISVIFPYKFEKSILRFSDISDLLSVLSFLLFIGGLIANGIMNSRAGK